MISNMSNECFREFISNISLVDLQNPHLNKVAEQFEQQFEDKAKQKQLLNSIVVIKQH